MIKVRPGNLEKLVIAVILFGCSLQPAVASHPLITDDTGTQGGKRAQFELNGEYGYDREEGGVEKRINVSSILSCGIKERIDIVLGLPLERLQISDAGSEFIAQGISDIPIEVKWRFIERGNLSLALKPGITVPTGDHENSLGNGEATYHGFIIATKKLRAKVFHLNIGYNRNENTLGMRKDLWHASVASEMIFANNIRAVMNVGIDRNPEENKSLNPVFLLVGIVYPLVGNVDLDCGLKTGLTGPATDLTLLLGSAFRF